MLKFLKKKSISNKIQVKPKDKLSDFNFNSEKEMLKTSNYEREVINNNYSSENSETREVRTKLENSNIGEIVTVHGITGELVNKAEIENWRGSVALSEYPINDDPNPEIIRRKLDVPVVNTTQEVIIKYLEAPTQPPPGEIIIQQEKPIIPPVGPPLILRLPAPEVQQKEALVIREIPPSIPPQINRKIVTIKAPRVPPPPRKLVVEKPQPVIEKPQSIIIERWLAPKQQARKVIFDESTRATVNKYGPIKNEIIEYEAPNVIVNKEFKELGVTRMDPNEYLAKYGKTLIEPHFLPDFVKEIRPSNGLLLASEIRPQKPILEGEIQLLQYVDLEKEGLGEYSSYVQKNDGLYYNSANQIGKRDSHYEKPNDSEILIKTRFDGANTLGFKSVTHTISNSTHQF